MKPLHIISYSLLCLLLAFACAAAAQPESPKKVLFVGNSFSFYNNGIHNHFGSLIRAAGDWKRGDNRVRLLTLSGGHIHEHIEGLDAYLSNDTRGWQAVVLQGHSNEPITKSKRKRFEAALEEAVETVRKYELEPILFMTWGYKDQPEMASELTYAYMAQAKKHDVRVVPVGLAFAAANKYFPNIDLYVADVLGVAKDSTTLTFRKDLKHPSIAGTYLAACVFYASLYNKSPEGNIFHAGLDATTATKLQALSWQVVSAFNTKD